MTISNWVAWGRQMRNYRSWTLVFGLALVGACVPSMLAGQEIFRSNAAAMRLQPITQAERDQHRYVIQVGRNGEAESERFFDHGELVHEIRQVPGPAGTRREEEYRNGELEAVRMLDSEERHISEEFFSDGALTERREYRYRGNLLVEMLSFDAAGELARSDEFQYGPGGVLRVVRTVDSAGRTRNAYYAALDGRLIEEYHEGLHTDIRVRYDEYNRPIDEVEYVDGVRTVSTFYTYESAAGSGASKIRAIDHGQERETLRTYTAGGDILEEREYRAGTFERGFAYLYDGDLLVERQGLGVARGVRELFEYNEDGALQGVRYLRNGRLQRERRYLDENEYIDVFYRDGTEVLRSYYRDDRRLREEVLQDGQVVRTREFE